MVIKPLKKYYTIKKLHFLDQSNRSKQPPLLTSTKSDATQICSDEFYRLSLPHQSLLNTLSLLLILSLSFSPSLIGLDWLR